MTRRVRRHVEKYPERMVSRGAVHRHLLARSRVCTSRWHVRPFYVLLLVYYICQDFPVNIFILYLTLCRFILIMFIWFFQYLTVSFTLHPTPYPREERKIFVSVCPWQTFVMNDIQVQCRIFCKGPCIFARNKTAEKVVLQFRFAQTPVCIRRFSFLLRSSSSIHVSASAPDMQGRDQGTEDISPESETEKLRS